MINYTVILAVQHDDGSLSSRSYSATEQQYRDLADIMGTPMWEQHVPAGTVEAAEHELMPKIVTLVTSDER